MQNPSILTELNPWWKTNQVPELLAPKHKRKLFRELEKYLPQKQILAIVGLRRTGKSTLLHQIIQKLLKENVPPKNILYYTFDDQIEELKTLLDFYRENILQSDFDQEKVYLFLDEIQKLDDWQNQLKIFYDRYPKIKFFVSGSASLNLVLDSKESLAGRVYYFQLGLLSFEEFLELRGKDLKSLKSNSALWALEIKTEISHYLIKPFPEIVSAEEYLAKRYIKESVIERAIFKDLSSLYEIKDLELINKLIFMIASNPGMLLNLDDLSNEFGRNRQTISNYLYYLETCFIIKSLKNYKGSLKVSSRKLKKYYLSHPALTLAIFSPDQGKIIENLIQFVSKAEYYWREAGDEADFILVKDKKILPIESKYSSDVKIKDIKGLLKFMEEFKVQKGTVITKDFESSQTIDKKEINFIPLWKWLIENSA